MDIESPPISLNITNDPLPFQYGLSWTDRAIKRLFDLVVATLGLIGFSWLILLAYILASIDTHKSGFFVQLRVGKNGRLFKVVKIRTMQNMPSINSTVTSSVDPRVTRLGRFFRRTKIDELPQLFNIFVGHMSLVGPRPDVPGFADHLDGEDRIILSIRPGITGPATLRFRDEETILANVDDPEIYNREVIFPKKVKLNKAYIKNYGFGKDINYILQTIACLF